MSQIASCLWDTADQAMKDQSAKKETLSALEVFVDKQLFVDNQCRADKSWHCPIKRALCIDFQFMPFQNH